MRSLEEVLKAEASGHPGLPAGGGGVQGHHPAAGRPRRLRPRGRGAGRVGQGRGRQRRGRQGGRDRGPWLHPGRPVALALGAGFVPVRKKGKLPAATYEESYELEYGEATIEVHQDAFAPGDRVLVIDDVLATGGTVEACLPAGPPLWRRGGRHDGADGAVVPAGPGAARGRAADRSRHCLKSVGPPVGVLSTGRVSRVGGFPLDWWSVGGGKQRGRRPGDDFSGAGRGTA